MRPCVGPRPWVCGSKRQQRQWTSSFTRIHADGHQLRTRSANPTCSRGPIYTRFASAVTGVNKAYRHVPVLFPFRRRRRPRQQHKRRTSRACDKVEGRRRQSGPSPGVRTGGRRLWAAGTAASSDAAVDMGQVHSRVDMEPMRAMGVIERRTSVILRPHFPITVCCGLCLQVWGLARDRG